METTWKYLLNQFLVSTRNNFKKTLKLSNYHDAMLKGTMDATPSDFDWAMLYNRYHPLHLAYTDAYTKWKNAGGTQQGQTLNMEQLLALLTTKVNNWDVQVQNVFDKTTPEYKSIFPDGRKPFNSGAINTRIIAVQNLGSALSPYTLSQEFVSGPTNMLPAITQNITQGSFDASTPVKLENMGITSTISFCRASGGSIGCVAPNVPVAPGATVNTTWGAIPGTGDFLNATNQLGAGVGTYRVTIQLVIPPPQLVAVKTQAEAFYALLDAARDVQEGSKGGTKTSSELLDEKRIPVMTMQYGNLGFLMSKYMNSPLLIEPFFELTVLRDHQQVLFTGTLDPAENEAVLIHTFAADDEIRFKITGVGQGTFYLSTTPGGTDSTPIVIVGGAEQTLLASAFGITDYGTHRYLTAINNGSTALDFEIELL